MESWPEKAPAFPPAEEEEEGVVEDEEFEFELGFEIVGPPPAAMKRETPAGNGNWAFAALGPDGWPNWRFVPLRGREEPNMIGN